MCNQQLYSWAICFFFQLVGRLSQEELMAQLPSFLPALFEAFGNQSADVRKVLIIFVSSSWIFFFLSLRFCRQSGRSKFLICLEVHNILMLLFCSFFFRVIDFGLCFDVCWWMVQTVVFCLVDIYIMLGKAFLPYLERLNSTQLRLVTIYANRISQARTGTTIDASQWGAGSFRKILWFWGVGLFFVVYLYIVWIHSGVFFFF